MFLETYTMTSFESSIISNSTLIPLTPSKSTLETSITRVSYVLNYNAILILTMYPSNIFSVFLIHSSWRSPMKYLDIVTITTLSLSSTWASKSMVLMPSNSKGETSMAIVSCLILKNIMTFIFKYALLQLLVQERAAVHVQEAH